MIKRSTVTLAGLVFILYVAFLPTAGEAVEVVMVVPGAIVLAGRFLGFFCVLYLLRWAMPEVQGTIRLLMGLIVDDD